MWSRSVIRSAPAEGMFARRSARVIASNNAPRERTRIMMSPARIRRGRPVAASTTRSSDPAESQPPTTVAMRSASATAGSSRLAASSGIRQSAGSGAGSGAIGAQISTRPGSAS